MWYDVTGQIPSESRPAPVALSETGSAAESPPSRINIRLPDLDQPVTEIPVEISERSGVPPLSHAAMVTLVAAGILGALVLWVAVFAGRDPSAQKAVVDPNVSRIPTNRPATPDKPHQIAPQIPPASSSLPSPVEGNLGFAPASSGSARGVMATAPVGSHSPDLGPSSQGWDVSRQADAQRPITPATSGAEWLASSQRPPMPGDYQAEAVLAATVGDQKAKLELPGGPDFSRTVASAPVGEPTGPLGNALEAQVKIGPAGSSDSGQALVATGAREYSGISLPGSETGISAGQMTQSDSPAASSPSDSGSPRETAPADSSPNSSSQIAGVAWLRGEREFTPRWRVQAATVGNLGNPNLNRSENPAGGGQMGLSPGSDSAATLAGTGESLPPSPASPLTTGIPQVAWLPQGSATPNLAPNVAAPVAAWAGYSSAPVDYSPPRNSQLVVNPTVIPTGAWQAMDASSFRWGSAPSSAAASGGIAGPTGGAGSLWPGQPGASPVPAGGPGTATQAYYGSPYPPAQLQVPQSLMPGSSPWPAVGSASLPPYGANPGASTPSVTPTGGFGGTPTGTGISIYR
jgi:hypothetical protein